MPSIGEGMDVNRIVAWSGLELSVVGRIVFCYFVVGEALLSESVEKTPGSGTYLYAVSDSGFMDDF